MKLNDALPILLDIKRRNRLVLFIGSGISMNSGLPSWDALMKQILQLSQDIYVEAKNDIDKILVNDNLKSRNKEILDQYKLHIDAAEKEISTHPIWTITVLKDQLNILEKNNIFSTKIAFYEQILSQFLSKEPHSYHKEIISSKYPILITTNYDDLLQKAARELNQKEYAYHAYDFNQPEKIANKIYYGEPFILHIHGKIRLNDATYDFEDIILTKNDYQRIRKDNPAIGQLLRTIFLNYSVLFVGYGANDPHVNDVIEEMSYFFPESPIANQHFIIWNESKGFSHIQESYNKSNRLNFVTISDWGEYETLFNQLSKI